MNQETEESSFFGSRFAKKRKEKGIRQREGVGGVEALNPINEMNVRTQRVGYVLRAL